MTAPAGLFRRVLITGSRDWHDRAAMNAALLEQGNVAYHAGVTLVVVHGAAHGADRMAAEWVTAMSGRGLEIREESHPVSGAAWRVEGLRAGHNRNQRMVDRGADVCLAFIMPCAKPGCRKNAGRPHESHGASDCVARAKLAGIPVIPYYGGK